MNDKKYSSIVSGVCFLLVFIIVYTAIAFGIGHSIGYDEAKALYSTQQSID